MTQAKNIAPPHLCEDGAELWQRLHDEFKADDEASKLLIGAICDAFCRLRSAQTAIDSEGMTTQDRFGQVKPHPVLTVERDARAQMLAALKQLHSGAKSTKSGCIPSPFARQNRQLHPTLMPR